MDVFRRKLGFPELKRMVIAKVFEYGPQELLIEDQSSGRQLHQQLRFENNPRLPFPIAVKPEGDKPSRLAGVSAIIEGGSLFLPVYADWLGDFKAELLAFPASRHKDQVDALSHLLNRVTHSFYDDFGLGLEAGPMVYTADDCWTGPGAEFANGNDADDDELAGWS